MIAPPKLQERLPDSFVKTEITINENRSRNRRYAATRAASAGDFVLRFSQSIPTRLFRDAKYVAFLRAINVGGHTVKMAHLKELFESLDFSNVETFIASGNVVFDSRSNSKSLERKIEKHLQAELGYEVSTFVRTIEELNRIAAHPAFSEPEITAEGNILYVSFTDRPPLNKPLVSCSHWQTKLTRSTSMIAIFTGYADPV